MTAPPTWLNHHQLQCFRVVAREGSLARAATVMRVSPQTLSEHVQQLESALGVTLFARGARGMALTDEGRAVLGYAEEIFSVGQALLRFVGDGAEPAVARLSVGVDESLAKIAVWSMLAPGVSDGATLSVREGTHDHLVALLNARTLDLVLSERPALSPDDPSLRCVLLRDEEVAWFASEPLASALREGFPASLDGAPVLLGTSGSELRAAAEAWIVSSGIRPRVLAEFTDSALAKAACADGVGAMLLPRGVVRLAASRYGLFEVGACEGVRQRAFAITTERLATHPTLARILGDVPEAPFGIS